MIKREDKDLGNSDFSPQGQGDKSHEAASKRLDSQAKPYRSKFPAWIRTVRVLINNENKKITNSNRQITNKLQYTINNEQTI